MQRPAPDARGDGTEVSGTEEGLFPEQAVPALRSVGGLNAAAESEAGAQAGTEPGAQQPAAERPIARIAIDTRVPHLDRLFDYLVPDHLDEQAVPGTRVRVIFNHREQAAWLIERTEQPESPGHELSVLREVISPVQALTPSVWELVQAVAARSVGLNADVLRLAVPPRAATAEKRWLAQGLIGPGSSTPAVTAPSGGDAGDGGGVSAGSWPLLPGGMDLLGRLADPAGSEPPRAVVVHPPGPQEDWAETLAAACEATARGGRRSLVIVADQRRLAHLQAALTRRFDADRIARLTHEDGQSTRYTGFLHALSGTASVVIGTRSAAFAPVPKLGLVACFDDGDHNFIERQAPYFHAREVLLLRAAREGAALVLCGYAVSAEALRLVGTGWAAVLKPERPVLRERGAVIRSSTDTHQLARDPLAAVARIPALAYETARDGLTRGPVLIQVARTGYVPTLACQSCRAPARCPHCQGPLSLEKGRADAARCRWCHRHLHEWRCRECGGSRWRVAAVGALRTAEELGRAFPQVPVINSSADAVKARVKPIPSIVVATPGAEPLVEGGYAAAILLDGDRLLLRDGLRTGEEVLRMWANAAALVVSRGRGGQVVTTGAGAESEAALVRWDPLGFVDREMAERTQLRLPPAVRSMALTGPQRSVAAFLEALRLRSWQAEGMVTVIDPVPVDEQGEDDEYRALVFFSYAVASELTARARSVRASSSASRRHGPVHVRCDAVDLL